MGLRLKKDKRPDGKLAYVYLRKSSHHIQSEYNKADLKAAWLSAVNKKIPYMTMDTCILRNENSEIDGCPNTQSSRKWGESVFVAGFQYDDDAREFIKVLKEQEIIKKHEVPIGIHMV